MGRRRMALIGLRWGGGLRATLALPRGGRRRPPRRRRGGAGGFLAWLLSVAVAAGILVAAGPAVGLLPQPGALLTGTGALAGAGGTGPSPSPPSSLPSSQEATGASEPALSQGVRGSSGWLEALVRLGLPFLDAFDRAGRLLWRPDQLLDWAVWLLGGFHPSRPVTALYVQVPAMAELDPEQLIHDVPEIHPPVRPAPQPDVSRVAPPQPVEPQPAPLVLIYHTHASESFYPALGPAAAASGPFTQDRSKDVVAVGDEVAALLQQRYGIPVLHLRTLFDAGGRDGAYAVSEAGVKAALQKYPSIRVLVDLHRDAAPRQATTTLVDGKATARLLFVWATGTPQLPNPYAAQDRAFEDALARAAQAVAPADPGNPSIVRQLADGDADPLTFAAKARYNQHLLPRSALVEVGGQENTLPEEFRAAALLAQAIARVASQEGLLAGSGG
ncbi:MAG: stage II sporulation protein P [Bacillota bacterium]|nr:stage II sporulation protein P [Bacillota bacterium]